jgi:uncharacterized membrane protein YbhN (UPF0104 family)
MKVPNTSESMTVQSRITAKFLKIIFRTIRLQSVWRTLLPSAFFIGIGTFTVWQLSSQFGHVSLQDVVGALYSQPTWHLGIAFTLTALSFACLAGYDVIGAHLVVPGRVPPAVALLAGAAANAVSNTLGFHAFTGTLLRVRIYRGYGLSLAEVARLVSLSWLALGLGFLAMLTIAQLAQAANSAHPGLPLTFVGFLAAGLLIFLLWLVHGPEELKLFNFTQPLPTATFAMLQMALGAVESAAAIGALYVLLPSDLAPSFPLFAVGYITAIALGLFANLPGGLGVFEASITALLFTAGRPDLLAALLLYRLIYNILPFVISVVALVLLQITTVCRQVKAG